jgi:soluble lytic murein transglycosylase-like protein
MEDKISLYPISIKSGNCLFSIIFILGLFLPSSIYKASDNTSKVIKSALAYKIQDQTRLQKNADTDNKKNRYLHFRARKSEHLFHPIIVEAANRYQVDSSLIKAVIMAESGYNPRAVSKKGAKGLMQLMPGTAEALGVEDSFNPKHNINGGVKYLSQLVLKFNGDIKLALAAYNAGSKKVKKYQGVPPFKATRYYIKKVIDYQNIYKKLMANPTNTV